MYGDTVMAYINPEYCREATVDEVDDLGGYCYNSGADDVYSEADRSFPR